jgi:hypothetical protein
VDIHIHQSLYKKANKPDDKLIYLAKLNEDRLRKKSVIKELEDYVSESNIWQSKRFNRKPQQ